MVGPDGLGDVFRPKGFHDSLPCDCCETDTPVSPKPPVGSWAAPCVSHPSLRFFNFLTGWNKNLNFCFCRVNFWGVKNLDWHFRVLGNYGKKQELSWSRISSLVVSVDNEMTQPNFFESTLMFLSFWKFSCFPPKNQFINTVCFKKSSINSYCVEKFPFFSMFCFFQLKNFKLWECHWILFSYFGDYFLISILKQLQDRMLKKYMIW